MIWIILAALSVLAAALLAYALWPWASKRQPQFVYRALVGALTLATLVGPSVAYRLSERAAEPVDLSAFPLPGGQAGFAWDGPLTTETDGGSHQADMSLDAMTARLAEKLKSQPDNVAGWVLLGRSYAALGNIASAKTVFSDLMKKWPNDVEVKVAYGEMLMAAAEGKITPEARQIFAAAVAADPKHTQAQYDLALADAQAGDDQAAYDRWLALAKSAPADAPWLGEVAARLRETAAKLGLTAPKIAAAPATAAPDPNPDQVGAAMQMSEGDRQTFIRGMVDGLAGKLKANPNDLQGWLRLGRSYGVLGEWDKAQAAYQDGLKAFPDNAELKAALAAASAD